VSLRGSKPVLAAKVSPISSEISVASSACAVPSMRTRARVGPMPRRTLSVACRLRLVRLEDGVVAPAPGLEMPFSVDGSLRAGDRSHVLVVVVEALRGVGAS
jgi:hypothetical protein